MDNQIQKQIERIDKTAYAHTHTHTHTPLEHDFHLATRRKHRAQSRVDERNIETV